MPVSEQGRTTAKRVVAEAWNPEPAVASSWTEMVPPQRVENFSLSGHIIAQIRTALFAEKLRPGDFLGSEASIAASFGVSRMAARDALRSLEALGIVTIRQGARGGVWVAQGDLDRMANA